MGARLILILALLASVLTLLRIDYSEHLSTDILALVQRDVGDAADQALAKELIDRQGRILAVLVEGQEAEAVAEAAVATLSASDAITKATLMAGDVLNDFGRTLFEERMALLFPRSIAQARAAYEGDDSQFAEWLAARKVERINKTLVSPEGLALADLLPADPLLLVAEAVQDISAGNASSAGSSLVLATLAGPPTDKEIQRKVASLLDEIRLEPGAEVSATGAVLFAKEIESRIRGEVFRLNLLMSGAVLAVILILIGSLRAVLLIVAPVVLGALAAVAITLGLADKVHVLTFALAGIIGGTAVDYPLHILLHRKDRESDYLGALGRVWRPLALGCATTALVFLSLVLSDLSLIRHTGMMVGCGLIIAGLMAVLVFAAIGSGAAPRVRAKQLLSRPIKSSKRALLVTLGLFTLCGSGLTLLDWRDSLESLQIPLPELEAQDKRVRSMGGLGNEQQLLVSTGPTLREAMANAASIPDQVITSGPADWVATPREVEAAAEWLEAKRTAFAEALARQLEEGGLDSTAFEPFFAALEQPLSVEIYETALARLFASAPAGMEHLAGQGAAGAWVITGIKADALMEMPAGTFPLDAQGFLGEAFKNYRLQAKQYAGAGFVVAAVLVLLIVGLKDGLLILAAPAVAVLASLGILGFAGAEGGLFHVVGLLLGFGLGLDYAVFRVRGHDGLASVRLSAITTLAAFGVLATSSIPAVASLGATVFLVVGIALVVCEAIPQSNGQVAEEDTTQAPRPAD